MSAPTPHPPPLGLGLAVLPLLVMLLTIVGGTALAGFGMEVLIVSMLVAAAVAGVVAIRGGHRWDEIERATGARLASVLPAILILLAIGMLIASWVLSGTIPWLVHLGIQLVAPRFLVLTAFVITALMSLATGTSWGAAGTLGVALVGTAAALDAPLAATAGAVVSGAYFGDKLSPLSDSTNICALGARANLYTHIRHLLSTTVPSALAAVVVYAVVGGRTATTTAPETAGSLLRALDATFRLGWPTLLPMLVVLAGILARRPPALVLATSSLVALGIGVGVQGFRPADAIVAVVRGFDADMLASLGHDPRAVDGALVQLLERGGLMSMAPTLIVILAAFLLTGALDVAGALETIVQALLRTARGVFGLVAATMTSGAVMIALTSHGGVTALVVGGLFRDAYRARRLAPENLSRALEDSVTIVEPLLPWTVSAVFMATTLGVPTTAYAPWAVFCCTGPVVSLLLAATYHRTGFGLRPMHPDT